MSGGIVAIKAARALNIKIVAHSHSQPENFLWICQNLSNQQSNNLWNKYLAWTI